jgi:hypothetical protein
MVTMAMPLWGVLETSQGKDDEPLAIPNLQIGLLVLNVHTTANLQNPVVY